MKTRIFKLPANFVEIIYLDNIGKPIEKTLIKKINNISWHINNQNPMCNQFIAKIEGIDSNLINKVILPTLDRNNKTDEALITIYCNEPEQMDNDILKRLQHKFYLYQNYEITNNNDNVI